MSLSEDTFELGENPSFRFEEFNPRRAMRGAPAARIWITPDVGQEEFWVWMSAADLRKNLKTFGEHEGLRAGLVAYGKA